MQKQPFFEIVEPLLMSAIIFIAYLNNGGWDTAIVAFLVVCLWFVTGENAFYKGYTWENKKHYE